MMTPNSALIADQSLRRLKNVAQAKVTGAWNLHTLPQDEALALLCARLEHHLGGLSRGGPVNLDAPIAALGVDSLTALELLNTLHAELGVRLPMATLFEATSARALAATRRGAAQQALHPRRHPRPGEQAQASGGELRRAGGGEARVREGAPT